MTLENSIEKFLVISNMLFVNELFPSFNKDKALFIHNNLFQIIKILYNALNPNYQIHFEELY